MSNMTLEGVLSLATKQSMLDSNIRSLEDLNDGDLVDGVIKNFNINNGLQVQIGTYSKGLLLYIFCYQSFKTLKLKLI